MLRSLIVFTALISANVAQAWTEPARGTQLRSDLMNSIRPVVAIDLRPPVQFVVSDLRHEGDVAFGVLQPQRPGGGEIAFSETRYPEQGLEPIDFDGLRVDVLWQKIAGRWYVIDYSIGATDAWYSDPRLCATFRAVLPEVCG